MPKQKQFHVPVLLKEVLQLLDPREGESYLDLTAGYGGHAAAVLVRTKNPAGARLIDRDGEAVKELQSRFKEADVVKSDFLSALILAAESKQQFDMILADLGVSSPHLETGERGFSLKHSGPLDMRMDQSQKIDAWSILNRSSEKQLARILRDYGQEPKARQIARKIVKSRPLRTTDQLAAIAAGAWPGKSKIHPATRTFQALRIAVNDELNQLEEGLPLMLKVLKPGGRLALISFHSLEDRLVKRFLAEKAEGLDAELKLLTKKPQVASSEEIVSNPRARSAKLRAAVKIKTNIERN